MSTPAVSDGLLARRARGHLPPDVFGLFAWAAGTGAELAPHAAGRVRCRSGSSCPSRTASWPRSTCMARPSAHRSSPRTRPSGAVRWPDGL